MIRVTPADEPEDFDRDVRKPGLAAIEKLLGKGPKGRGRPPKTTYSRVEDIPASALPDLWAAANLLKLYEAYNGTCAYLAIRIPRAVGSRTVDHRVAKNQSPELAYEWSNYRLACSLMNSRKATFNDVLDPFEVHDEWFELDPVGRQVLPAQGLSPDIEAKVQDTIDRLELNDYECCAARSEWLDPFLENGLPFALLEKWSPFVAREVRRQNIKASPPALFPEDID